MKPIPWWYTHEGNDKENEFFCGLYYEWARNNFPGIPSEQLHKHRAFIAEQLAGENIEKETR